MVALAIQTIGGIGMACCKLCIPCLRQIGIRLADPLPPFVACIPFATTVATVGAIIGTTYGYPAAATGFRKLRCAAGRHLGTGIQSNCPRSSSDGSTVRAIIGTYIYGCAAAATGFRKLRCESYTKHRHLGTGIRTSSSACSAVISTTAFDFCIAAITTSGFRSGIAVITAAWLREMPL